MNEIVDDLERQVELQKLYLRNMQKIKWRTKAIFDVLKKKTSTTFEATNIEFCILQIRKILELIALSSLISDADIYKQKMKNIESMWNAKYILRDLERINPHFYPQPIKIIQQEGQIDNWVNIESSYLTIEKFISIYEKCGKYMHEFSPFLTEQEINLFYKSIKAEIKEWMELIINLLNCHIVHLYNNSHLFCVFMNEENKPPVGNIFTAIKE